MVTREEWRPVVGAPSYEVSSEGRVRSIDRVVVTKRGHPKKMKGVYLRPCITQAGYQQVAVMFSGKTRQKNIEVHRLVADAFLPPCPGTHGNRKGDYHIDHVNDDRLDNRAANLRWLTREENWHLKYGRLGNRGESHHRARLTEEDVKAIRCDPRSVHQLCVTYDMSRGAIDAILSRRSWRHI